ncbi:hypothetical protein [Streptomyces sp. NPDC048172]|uniref:hypothetical protein n=1 Tax=Streptomyces sp. NPDC048172 TaxID=3365505 RepID=UPI003713A752
MTGCAMDDGFTVAADGSYAARLSSGPGSGGAAWFPERWTLEGPEPYAVPLPGGQPEEPDSQVLPLADGRVLIARRSGDRQLLALLYPSGDGTGELDLGAVEAERLALLPPAPCGTRAYGTAPAADGRSTGIWLLAGGSSGGPERVAVVDGRCAGGAWLDREGRLLAVDRTESGEAGRTKTVVVDLGRGGEISPLLQITEESNDRLLRADPDSGLLLVRSDAPGEDRLGWGVLGSHRPVRFPEVLHPAQARLTPFAVQPRQMLLPESCAVALRVDAAQGTWLAVWRPGLRELRHLAAPPGWLAGKGLWTEDGELRVPYSTPGTPCGLARLRAPLPEPEGETARHPAPPAPEPRPGAQPEPPTPREPTGGDQAQPVRQEPTRQEPAPQTPVRPESAPQEPAWHEPVRPEPPGVKPEVPPARRPDPRAAFEREREPGPEPRPEPGPQRGGAVSDTPSDVTSVQHRGHAAKPSASGSVPPRAAAQPAGGGFSAGSTGVFGALADPVSKPVPLQQAPLASGTA